jgi:hypothetical protein
VFFPWGEESAMRRFPLAVCLSGLVALVAVCPARACINDRETVRTESEFRKHYEFRSGYHEAETPAGTTTKDEWVPIAATVSGLGLLACSAALVTVNVRRLRRS